MTFNSPGDRPLRFGVQLKTADNVEAWLDEVRRAEDAGYDVLTMSDHVPEQLAPLVALTAAASVTSSIRLGTWVLCNDFRHPTILAKEAATLDWLSGGRLELGIGAGWMKEDYEQSGIALDPPGLRIERMAEAVQILRGLWGKDPFSFEGVHYSVRELDGAPKPIQDPLPIQIGGGAKRVLSLAAREADIVGLGMKLTSGEIGPDAGRSLTAEATERKLGFIRDAAGSRWSRLVLNARVLLVSVVNDAVAAAEELGRPLALSAEEVLATPHAFVGDLDRIVDHILACRERYGVSYFTVSQEALTSLAPMVSKLAGQ